MKLRTESGKEYDVRFGHARSYPSQKIVTTFADVAGLRVGKACCHPNDNSCKSYGRKLALKRAIADLPREERRQIWAAYFAATGGVK